MQEEVVLRFNDNDFKGRSGCYYPDINNLTGRWRIDWAGKVWKLFIEFYVPGKEAEYIYKDVPFLYFWTRSEIDRTIIKTYKELGHTFWLNADDIELLYRTTNTCTTCTDKQ